MIRDRQVTSSEVVDAHLARIEEVNPNLNAVTVTLAAEARAAAASVDRAVAARCPARAAGRRAVHRQGEHRRSGRDDDLGSAVDPQRERVGQCPRPTGSRTRAKRIRPLMGGLCRGAGTHRGSVRRRGR